MMNKGLKVAAITGASRGIGAAVAELLAKDGYALILGSRNKEALEEFASKLKKDNPDFILETAVIDVRKKEDCSNFIAVAERKFGRLDLLINNAGMIGKRQFMENIDEEELQETFETNVYGVFFCTQAGVKIMKKQGSGHILSIGSTSALDGKSSNLAYGSSKSALVGFTDTLCNELSGTGIRVSIFHPGVTRTNIFQRF